MPARPDPLRAFSGIASAAELPIPDKDTDTVIAVDTLVDGVHFPSATPPADVGFKALAVNLSDLAAMGAEPLAARVALTLADADGTRMRDWRAAFEKGLAALAARHGVALVAPTVARGQLGVSVEVIGSVPRGMALRRDGARPGDCVLVTGTLGDAGLALADESAALAPRERARLEARLARPEPRIAAGVALRGLASAAIDVSDGLAADLGHVLAASAVGARVMVERLPLSATLAATLPRERAWALALACGDDYELCFTVAPAKRAEAERRLRALGCPATHVGDVSTGGGLACLRADGARFDPGPGYRHFQ